MTSFELRLPSLELFKVPLVVIEILEMSGLQLRCANHHRSPWHTTIQTKGRPRKRSLEFNESGVGQPFGYVNVWTVERSLSKTRVCV